MKDILELLFSYPPHLYKEGKVVFTGAYAAELRIALAVLLALVVYRLFRRIPARIPRSGRVTLFGLRTASMLLMLALILPPVLRTSETTLLDRFIVFLVDDSRSMTVKDAAGGKTRMTAAKHLLTGKDDPRDFASGEGLLAETADLGGARVFRFSDAMERVDSLDELTAGGDTTDLYAAIKAVDERFRGVPLAALVILSDGAHTAQNDPINAAKLMTAKGVPVFTVGLGDANPPPDREIVAVNAPRVARRPASIDVGVTVGAHGYKTPYVVRLLEGSTKIGEVSVTPRDEAEVRQVKIPLFLNRDGVFTCTVEVMPEQGEKVVSNNSRQFRIEVLEKRLPVLYMEGSPRTEYRFVRGALFRDRDFKIVTVLRTGGGEGGKTRYLVQGAEADSPQYRELLEGFPSNKELLNQFEAVILGDIEASELTTQKLAMLEEFVSKNGGGLLMLGGVNSFSAGKYEGTPVGKMLPVELAAGNVPYDPKEFRVRVAEAGITHPILRQVEDPVANETIWNGVSPLIGRNPVTKIKPGAQTLMESMDTGEPVLAVQNYGAGRTAAFTTGGSWFWRMDREIADHLHERFWRQLVRWLSVGAQPQLAVQTDKDTYMPKDAVVLQATVLGKNLEPLNDAVVTAVVESPFGTPQEVKLEWILSQDGVYQARYIPHDQGEYKVTYKVRNPQDDSTMESHSLFGVHESFTEFTRAWLNESLMKSLASQTGGAYYPEQSAGKVAQEIRKRLTTEAPVEGQFKLQPLWDMTALLGLLLALLVAEWHIRRRLGLP